MRVSGYGRGEVRYLEKNREKMCQKEDKERVDSLLVKKEIIIVMAAAIREKCRYVQHIPHRRVKCDTDGRY